MEAYHIYDSKDDRWFTVNICDDCAEAAAQAGEPYLSVGEYDESLGEECWWCNKTLSEETEERAA